jgi:hypothetical protein
MPGFKEEFARVQAHLVEVKLSQIARRAIAIQTRNKIKPSAMNPSLLNK